MQFSTALTIVGILAIGLQTSQAQLTEKERARALDILRKQLADEQGVKTQPPAKPAAPAKPEESKPALPAKPAALPAAKPAPAQPKTAAVVPSTGFNQDRALEILRRALSEGQGLPAPAVETPKAAKSVRKAGSDTPKAVSAETKPAPASSPAAAEPAAPAGPKTKTERLAELNALYFADKLSPEEYHVRRAKILAE